MSRFILQANNIHEGGGKHLLVEIIQALPKNNDTILLLDTRLKLDSIDSAHTIIRIQPKLPGRLKTELWLRQNVKSDDRVLCFGNLPPLFKLRGVVSVFFHDRLLIDRRSLKSFPWHKRLKLHIGRLWLLFKAHNADRIYVQTKSMKSLLEKQIEQADKIRLFPFMKNMNSQRIANKISDHNESRDGFIYVASFEAHKNHHALLTAWQLLKDEGIYQRLYVTLSKNDFCKLIKDFPSLATTVINIGVLEHEELMKKLHSVQALIYPSLTESFGLPLLEASSMNLPIIAPELDYVRDVITPAQTFDPYSAVSISRAVKRFLGKKERGICLLDAEEFIKKLFHA